MNLTQLEYIVFQYISFCFLYFIFYFFDIPMSSKDSKGMYGFDPSGLERAAAAAKFLDQSDNAKNAFDLAVKREETTKLDLEKKIKYSVLKLKN